ncbi:MAG: branched-chain amino acid ABC transporter permease [Acidimicrobiia bacterium]|nr:branched-chain amino acid ABC transporter permease [Acidimicrobiia bacterium]
MRARFGRISWLAGLIGGLGSSDGSRPYLRDCIIVSLAVAPTGVTFGVVADAAGFDLARIVVMSALVFTGASQFAAVGVVNDGGSGGAAVGSALLLAARNALYGPVMRRALPTSAPARMGAAQFVIDETTALSTAQTNRRDATGAFWFSGVILWLVWNACSVAGALLGAVLGTPETWGLDAAFPAILVALLAPHVRTAAGRTAALAAAAVALGVVPVTEAGVPILVSIVALAPALWVRARRKESPAGGDARDDSPRTAP